MIIIHEHQPLSRENGVVIWLSIPLLFGLHIVRSMTDLIHPDVAWYLYGTGRLLHGAKLYHDIVDINPPLVYLLHMPPVWLAGVLGISATAVFKGLMLVLVAVVLVICSRLLVLLSGSFSTSSRRFILLILTFLFVSVAAGNFGYLGSSFGQREHMMMLLATPYLLGAIAQASGVQISRRQRWMVALMAGIGISLKPHFILMWLAVEGCVFFVGPNRNGWKRLENVVIAVMLACYWALVAAVFPEYFQVSAAVMQVYGVYDATLWVLLTQQAVVLWVVAVVFLLMQRSRLLRNRATLLFFVAGTAFLLVALLQRKGWGYQSYPARVAILLSLAIALNAWFDVRKTSERFAWFTAERLRTLITILMLVAAAKPAVDSFRRPVPGLVPALLPIVKQHAQGRSILVLSTALDPQFPLVVYGGVSWSSRYPQLWFVPGFYEGVLNEKDGRFPYHDPSSMSALERQFFEDVITDVITNPPELLLNNIGGDRYPMGKSSFNFLDYYSMDQRFSELFQQYRLIKTVDNFTAYKRQPIDLSLTLNQH